MGKVESHIKVVMEMDVTEARELKDILSNVEGGYTIWEALEDALRPLAKVK